MPSIASEIRGVQEKLKILGYYKGGIDGDFGPKSRAALKTFQRANRLVDDGVIGTVTLEVLNKAMAAYELSAKLPSNKKPTGKLRAVHTLVWHCTATNEGVEFTRAQIKAMHLARGFTDIGYHKLIHLDGTVSEGRDESVVGAHVAGHNTGTLGYSYVGGVSRAKPGGLDTRTAAQKVTMERLTVEAIAKYGLKAVKGHRDFSPDRDGDGLVEPNEWIKVCPCFDVRTEYGHLLK